ncbi:PRADC1-like protein [Anoplophora glabripennis]|uniref:PRADC1-like protein n=1 Tax=Anoplophora glabripennis TaxID=217634 RepID=UPI000873AECA|nr:PRADC1-like protein [Anoplophora glabripennis]XP_018580199.1 PRADC1-like protein [Anoplophora glabripennis]XP_018580200.1 PRADC1-like protein [Anoplophora glabripennis]
MKKQPEDIFRSIILYVLNVCSCVVLTHCGANTLHLMDGTSTAEVINGDIFFEIVDPAELEYTYRIRPAKDFGAPFNESFHVKNVPLVPVSPRYGCKPPDNLDDVEGNVAFIERGECSFKTKCVIAEKAGAKAVIISDIDHSSEDYFIEMIDDNSSEEVNIPAAYLMGKNGLMILKTLEKLKRNYAIINLPVNLTFTPVHKMNQPPWLGW